MMAKKGSKKWFTNSVRSLAVATFFVAGLPAHGQTDNTWMVSFGGTTSWHNLNSSKFGIKDLRFGDFDGDGKADVFAAWGGQWHISFGGVTGWQTVNGSSFGISKFRFGDFNGDGKTDVFSA